MTVGAIGAAGVGMQVGGQIAGALQARQAGTYNARVAEANAQAESLALLNEAAQHERIVAMLHDELRHTASAERFEAARLNERLRRDAGTLRAMLGASGLALAAGSPNAVLEHQARQHQVDRLAQRFAFTLQRRALGEEITQQTFAAETRRFQAGERLRLGGQQASLLRTDASQRFTAGLIGAAGSGLRGVQMVRYLQARSASRAPSGARSVPSAAAAQRTPVTIGGGFGT